MIELFTHEGLKEQEMAVRIGAATETSPESWLFMQMKLDLWKAGQKKLTNVRAFRKAS